MSINIYDATGTNRTAKADLSGSLIALTQRPAIEVIQTFVPLDGNVTPIGWWNADEANVTKNESDEVSQLDDLSGNSRHLVQATTANKPIWYSGQVNGEPAIRLDGTDDFMDVTSWRPSGAITIMVVRNFISFDTSTQVIISFHNTGNPDGGITWMTYAASGDHDHLGVQTGTGGTWVSGVNDLEGTNFVTGWEIDTFRVDTGDTEVYINNTLEVDDNSSGSIAASTNDFSIGYDANGGGSYANIEFAEIVVWDEALSASDRTDAWNFLENKYNIAI